MCTRGHILETLVMLQKLFSCNRKFARCKQFCIFPLLKRFHCWHIVCHILESNLTILYLISADWNAVRELLTNYHSYSVIMLGIKSQKNNCCRLNNIKVTNQNAIFCHSVDKENVVNRMNYTSVQIEVRRGAIILC